MPPTPFDFRATRPAGTLSRFVESIWYARGTVPYEREKIAPTGSTVAVFVLGDPIVQTPDDGAGTQLRADRGFLVGPHDRPTLNEPTGETFAVGVVTTPVGCEATFGIGPSQLRGRVMDLEGFWPAASPIRASLLSLEPDAMLALLQLCLADTVAVDPKGLDRCEAAVNALETDPTRAISEIAASLNVSHGHLDSDFTRVVGLSPRSLARLLRMRRLLGSIDVHGSLDWAELAATSGWFDQAHLIRDFKRHTGVTPTQYLHAQRSNYTTVNGADAAGFVPI